jgi:dolichol-phosphate mannosyltransferase
MRTVIVIPTFNEISNLPRLLTAIREQPIDVDILIVDDDSPDGTGLLADDYSRRDSRIKVLHRKRKDGIGRAYQVGFRWALSQGYEIFLQMDADLSHDPGVLPDFLEKIREYDAVFGSRYYRGIRVHNWSFKRLLLSKVSNDFIRFMLRLNATDITTAFKCFRRDVLASIDLESFKGRQNAFLIELVNSVTKGGFRTCEIPFTFRERESGESKMEFRVALESLWTVARLMFSRKGRRTSSPLSN